MKLFIVLGNQLFSPKYFADYKDHTFFMAEDYGLCTFEKHHKHKIILFRYLLFELEYEQQTRSHYNLDNLKTYNIESCCENVCLVW